MKKSITVRIDDTLKAQAESVMSRLEVSPTEAINHLYLYLVQHGQLPFRITQRADAPVDVFRDLLICVRLLLDTLQSIAALPEASAERSYLTGRCRLLCEQLRLDIDGEVDFLASVTCRDPLPREPDEDTGVYWRSMQEHLLQAEGLQNMLSVKLRRL